jgi:DNA-binding NarL/FixJ family response regulator
MSVLEREPMLAQLRHRHAEARRGRGQMVLVSGEAGIGKTTLVDAFVSTLPRATRVLRGSCDPVVPRRPFAPIVDIADQVGRALTDALDTGDRDRVFDAFLAILRAQRPGSVVVLEDLHWADSSTLDLVRIVGRRLRDTGVLLVGTTRDGADDGAAHLGQALADVPAGTLSKVPLPSLSVEAVRTLAAGTALDPVQLHRSTGGNPFFVTEVIASGSEAVPASVRDAVSARVARMSPSGQHAVRAAAVLGSSVQRPLIGAVADLAAASAGVRECVSAGLLIEAGEGLPFRHELARRAVLDGLSARERAGLHGRALAALRSGTISADPMRMVEHAIESGDASAIADLAPPAADRASRLGAHGEAADYLAITLALRSGLDDRTRGELLERYAHECSVCERVAAARTAQDEALAVWRKLGDRLREGDGLRAMSTYMWLGGEGDRARQVAESAVDVLESAAPHSPELAQALATVAQRRLVAGPDDEATARWAARALDMAEAVGEETIAVHALTTLAVAEIYPGGETGWVKLDAALERAKAIGEPEAIARVLINFVEAARDFRRYDLVDRYVDETVAFLAEHAFDLYRDLLSSRLAALALERGRWQVAEEQALALLAETVRSNQVRVRALEVMGRLRARRGEPGAWAALDEAMAIVGRGELQEIVPLYGARAELAWLEGDVERAGDEAVAGLEAPHPGEAAWWFSEVSYWAWRAGRIDRLPDFSEQPYALLADGKAREAADAWAAIGCPYQQAAALAESEDEAELREALAILLALGASVLAHRVTLKLRGLGARRIPRGPRATTRANPGGLSRRELEVLSLVRAGARNADIATRLVISPKTVDHHVSAILRKLGVADRDSAGRAAERLGLQDGEVSVPD